MIYQRYSDFRGGFALVGAAIDIDGFEVWPLAKLRAGGLGPIAIQALTTFPAWVTINALAADAMPGVPEFDFFVSQRTDDPDAQYITVSPYSLTQSGSISIDLVSANVAKLFPGLVLADWLMPERMRVIFKDVHIYCQRRSDKAYVWTYAYGNT